MTNDKSKMLEHDLNYQRNIKKFMSKFKINNFLVNETSLPYVIAEIGVNHEGCRTRLKCY